MGLIYELTGPQSQDLDGVAHEFSDLNREVTYSDISPEEWEQKLKRQGMPEHLTGHLLAMGELHRAGRYDRQADGVQRAAGDERPGICVALRGGVRRTSLLKGTPRQEHSCKPSR
jgi:NAD(P)H dehydrogenase (quinone)